MPYLKLEGTSNCNGKDFEIGINNKVATFRFCKNTTGHIDMRNPHFVVPLQATLTQFSTIDQVIILNKDGGCWNDMSGAGFSCQIKGNEETTTYNLYLPKLPQFVEEFSYVEPVRRSTSRQDIATFLAEELFKGPTQEEKQQGFSGMPYLKLEGSSNCNGKDFEISINNKVATFRFCRNTTGHIDMRNPHFVVPLQATLTQFSTIDQVIILNMDGNCWNDMSGVGYDCQVR